ncbi:MAG TPA: S41 family peptidase [Acidimicrobiia bacterium]|nr:S41 family peptidase [Acidimicrobiia bacterium]
MASRNLIATLVTALMLASCTGSRGVSTSAATTVPETTVSTAPATTSSLPEDLILPAQCQGVPITTIPPGGITTTTLATTELDAGDQQRLVDSFDEHVREVYFDPDLAGVPWEQEIDELLADVATGLATDILYERLDALLVTLGDDHSRFESPEQVALSDEIFAGENDYVGIGILALGVPEEGLISIISVLPDSPAAAAGLQPHDSIVAVDGIPLGEEPGLQASRLRGPECTIVAFTVRSPDGSEREITTVRARVQGNLPVQVEFVPAPGERRVAYMLIPTFADTTIDDQVREALEELGPLDGIILDLRTNGGGSSLVAEPVMALFVSGTLGEYTSRDGSRSLEIDADPIHNTATVPLAVLIGEHTESYGEIVAGILGERPGTILVGETTEGNVETLHGFALPGGSMVWIAAEVFRPAGDPDADWERDGIVPDLVVATDWQDISLEADPAIDAATEALFGS